MSFGLRPGGKPFVDRPQHSGLAFSLSHTAGKLVVVVAQGKRVGIDIEEEVDFDTFLASRQFLATEECSALDELDREAQPRAFTWLWCLKEAYLKGVGVGLSNGLDSAAFSLKPAPRLMRSVHRPVALWQFRLGLLFGSAVMAVAVEDAKPLSISVDRLQF